jgi:hypothetical protein
LTAGGAGYPDFPSAFFAGFTFRLLGRKLAEMQTVTVKIPANIKNAPPNLASEKNT